MIKSLSFGIGEKWDWGDNGTKPSDFQEVEETINTVEKEAAQSVKSLGVNVPDDFWTMHMVVFNANKNWVAIERNSSGRWTLTFSEGKKWTWKKDKMLFFLKDFMDNNNTPF